MSENHNQTAEHNKQNEATKASDQFIEEKQNKFTRAIGTVLRTASTEFLTWIGAPFVPMGLFSAVALANRDVLKQSAIDQANQIPGLMNKIGVEQISQNADQAINLFAGVGVGASVFGGLATGIGTAIGWQGAKHDENSRILYKLGKIAEFAGLGVQLLTGIPAYPIAKGFSVAATFFSQLKRPGSF